MRNILIVITSIFLFNTFLCAFVSSCVDIIGINSEAFKSITHGVYLKKIIFIIGILFTINAHADILDETIDFWYAKKDYKKTETYIYWSNRINNTDKNYKDYKKEFIILRQRNYSYREIALYASKHFKVKVSKDTVRNFIKEFE